MSEMTQDEARAREFSRGVISALTVMYLCEPSIDAAYEEVVNSHGPAELVVLAKRDGNYEPSGLKKWARLSRGGHLLRKPR